MKRTPLNTTSKKRRTRENECRKARAKLVNEVGRCELPGHIDRFFGGQLLVHEIARGPARQSALDKRYATLVVCWWCHTQELHGGMEPWPESRQLAVLKVRRPKDFDLEAYNKLRGMGTERITEEDVNAWNEK